MTYLGRRFGLSDIFGIGVSCGAGGVFVGAIPLLEKVCGRVEASGRPDQWEARPVSDINRDLSACYGVPVEFDRKIDGLRRIAQALSRGDLFHAQIATLHLQIPDPPALPGLAQAPGEMIQLARQLQASELLKGDWDPAKHPRWPTGSPGGIGGEFAPAGAASNDSTTADQNAPVIPAQITIPVPFELPGGIPFPSEIMPPPVIPNINPRDLPRNPYPDRPECEEEWAEATSFCLKLKASNQLGRGDYRGMGTTLSECIMGQVSEDCGGNSTGT
jgi:hypothetical protein